MQLRGNSCNNCATTQRNNWTIQWSVPTSSFLPATAKYCRLPKSLSSMLWQLFWPFQQQTVKSTQVVLLCQLVVAWTVIRSSCSIRLATAGILLSCLVEMVGERVGEMVAEMAGERVVKIGVEGLKFFTLCRLPMLMGFHQVPEKNTFFE